MLTANASTPPAPDAGLLTSVSVPTWPDVTRSGHVALLLTVHPPVRRSIETASTTEARVPGLGAALGLAPSSELLPGMREDSPSNRNPPLPNIRSQHREGGATPRHHPRTEWKESDVQSR